MENTIVSPENTFAQAMASAPADNSAAETTTNVATETQPAAVTDNDAGVQNEIEGAGETTNETTDTGAEPVVQPQYRPTYFDEELQKEVFIRTKDEETGEQSVYLTREEAERGIVAKDAYIGQLKTQLNEATNTSAGRIVDLESQLAILQRSVSQDQARELMVKEKMPEDQREVDPTALDEDQYKTWRKVRVDAELEVERDLARVRQQAQEAQATRTKAREDAMSHINTRTSSLEFFGLTNSEDRLTVDKVLSTKVGEQTIREMAVHIAQAFGKEQADAYLRGATESVRRSNTTTTSQVEQRAAQIEVRPQTRQVPAAPVTQTGRPEDTFMAALTQRR